MDFLPGAAIGFIPSESTGELNVIDTGNFKVIKIITLPPGSRPMSVKVSFNGQRIYVSNGRAGTVSVLDAHTYELLNTIKVGIRPWGIARCPRTGGFLYSANGPSNDVSVVDLEANKEIARVKAGTSPGLWRWRPSPIEGKGPAAHGPMVNTSCTEMLRVNPSL